MDIQDEMDVREELERTMTENEYRPWTETDETETAYWKRRYLEEVKTVERLRSALTVIAATVVPPLQSRQLPNGVAPHLLPQIAKQALEASDD